MYYGDEWELHAKSQQLVAKSMTCKADILIKKFNYKMKYHTFRFKTDKESSRAQMIN